MANPGIKWRQIRMDFWITHTSSGQATVARNLVTKRWAASASGEVDGVYYHINLAKNFGKARGGKRAIVQALEHHQLAMGDEDNAGMCDE